MHFLQDSQQNAQASIVFEDKAMMAFLDIRPLTIGHTLVVPKAHYVDIFDIPDELLSQVYLVTKRIALAVKKATSADGISIIQQNGKAAGQDIFHLHVHIVPRFEGQKLPHFHELVEVERATLDTIATKIKEKL